MSLQFLMGDWFCLWAHDVVDGLFPPFATYGPLRNPFLKEILRIHRNKHNFGVFNILHTRSSVSAY